MNDFDYVRQLVHTRSAIVLEPGKEYLVEARLGPIARKLGLTSTNQLVEELRKSAWSNLHGLVVEALTTNETSFFRDVAPFEALRKRVLPELIRARAATAPITIWSAASSSGQEIYSIAMLIREHFPALANRVSLIATDLSNAMVARGQAGVYSQLETNRGLPAPLLVKYFRRCSDGWEISEDIRRMVRFKQMNLTDAWAGFTSVDIVFMRNILIYFDLATKKTLLWRVRQLLPSDGVLFLGSAETTLSIDTVFTPIIYEKTTYYKVGNVS